MPSFLPITIVIDIIRYMIRAYKNGYVNFLVGNYFSLNDLPAIILKRRSKSNHLFNIPINISANKRN